MISNPRFFSLALLVFYFIFFGGSVFSQRKKGASLTRDDVVIKRNKTTVYICADRKLRDPKKKGKVDALWLRIQNNTIWTIRFGAEKKGTFEKPLKLSNGKIIPGLTNESVAFPRYEIEANKARIELDKPQWGDFGTTIWLPSNTSALFSVPIRYIETGTLLLQYKYEWEFTGAIGDESHAPVHKVYFDIADMSDVAGRLCD